MCPASPRAASPPTFSTVSCTGTAPSTNSSKARVAHPGIKLLSDRDRALMRRLVATILRRLGTLNHVLSRMLDRGLPSDAPRAKSALLTGAAQILWMDVPDHAAVDLSVRLVQADRRAAKYAGLVNAVLRRCARDGAALLDETSDTLDVPPWLMARWSAHYGAETARAMAQALTVEPSLDLTLKSDAAHWAARLHGEVLPTGTVRTVLQGAVPMLPGYDAGQWWVQDAAAALPARLLGDIAGRRVIDLCAAPGGKTAHLLELADIELSALELDPLRAQRIRANLDRLGLEARIQVADCARLETWWDGRPFDRILADVPCSASGVVRRHPDIKWLRRDEDIAGFAAQQARIVDALWHTLAPGGTMLYVTCSVFGQENAAQLAAFLRHHADAESDPIDGFPDCQLLPDADHDGFYFARLRKKA